MRLDRFTELMVIQAPLGFGKTALLDSWFAIQRANGEPALRFDATSLRLEQLQSAQTELVVVDDVDQPLSQAVNEALVNLTSERGIRVLVAGREVDGVRRSAWRRGVHVSSLDASELAATPAELMEMAQIWGHDLDIDRATAVCNATEGWPGVSRLLLDAADPDSRALDLDAAIGFLDATVIDSLPPAVRRAAGALALAEQVTDSHLRTVVAHIDDPAVEERQLVSTMERAQLLHRRTRESGWTMSPVLRHTLRFGVHGPPATAAREWHRRFATVLQEDAEEAHLGHVILHARGGTDWRLLNDIWTRFGLSLLDRYPAAFVMAYRNLPQSAMTRWRYLAVPVAVAAWAAEKRPYAEVHRVFSESLRPLAADYRARAEEEMTVDERLAGAAAAIATDRLDGRLRRSLAIGERVEAQIGSSIAEGQVPMRYGWFLGQWAMTALAAADWRGAVHLFSRSYEAAHTTTSARFVAADSAAHAALLTAFDGATDDARRWLARYRHFADPHSHTHGHVARAVHLAEAILAMDALDVEATDKHLERVGEVGVDLELWPYHLYVRAERALHFGDPVGMHSQLEGIRALHRKPANEDGAGRRLLDRMEADLLLALGEVNRASVCLGDDTAPWLATSRARLHLITGDAARARHWASATRWIPETAVRDHLERLLIKAVAAQDQGLISSADRAFQQAAALAAKIGTLRGYLSIPRRALEQLLARSPDVLTDSEVDRVRAVPQTFPETAPLIVLSPREHVVLQQLTRFDSARKIAQALTVSPNTVKKQIVAVYAKLGVHDRESALLEAYRLGLLPGSSPAGSGGPVPISG